MNPIRQYELVIEIARYGSISKAAEVLHLSQPTLSKYLTNLEKQLGLELFDRTSLPIRLTVAGRKYVEAGQRIIDVHRQLEVELDDIKSDSKSEVVIGISPTRAAYILPDILNEFQKINKTAKVIVRERTTKQLKDDLLRGDIDMSLTLLMDATRQFETVELFREDVCLAVPEQFSHLDVMDVLKSVPVISTGASLRLGRLISDILNNINAPKPRFEIQSIESALSLVKAGYGALLVPSYIAQYNKSERVMFKSLPDKIRDSLMSEFDRSVCIFYRKEQFLTESQRDLIAACKKAFQE